MLGDSSNSKVDVIVNVYGKPYQTAVGILSLMKFSKGHIGKIYIILEKKQPDGFDEGLLRDLLKDLPIEYYTPPFFFGWWEGRRKGIVNKILLNFKQYRYSIRYQYAWENSKAPYLFLMHNDMLYTGDLIGHYLSKIGNHVGIGAIGQCWNCPAHEDGCDGDKYWDKRYSDDQIIEMYRKIHEGRAVVSGLVKKNMLAWPLPECRLNEHAALINMRIARPLTSPIGAVQPIGVKNELDNGILWFQGMSIRGQKMVNESYRSFAKHAWTNQTDCGHLSLFDSQRYNSEEELAKVEVKKYINLD